MKKNKKSDGNPFIIKKMQGKVTAPSAGQVTSLIRLLQSGIISLGPCLPEFYASIKIASDAAPSTSKIPLVLSVGLTEKALQDAAVSPEDERQRAWQLQLLDLFRWLTPLKTSSKSVDIKNEISRNTEHGTIPSSLAPAVLEGDGQPDGEQQPEQQQEEQDDTEEKQAIPSPPMSPRSKAQHAYQEGNFDASQLYKSIKPLGNEPELQGDFPQLKPTLRKYQRRAAYWMVSKELQQMEIGADTLHPLWQAILCAHFHRNTSTEITSTDGSTEFYVNMVTGRLSTEKFPAPTPPKGTSIPLNTL